MKSYLSILCIFIICINVNARDTKLNNVNEILKVPSEYTKKIGSGNLIRALLKGYPIQVSEKNAISPNYINKDFIKIAVYQKHSPTAAEIIKLNELGIKCFPETWTPPIINFQEGFFICDLPAAKLNSVLSLPNVERIDLADDELQPQGNLVSQSIGAKSVWSAGYTGKGVKLAIIDSGLDTDPENPELPSNIIKKNYSYYPVIDDNVENSVICHGTLVTGLACGQGTLSADNTGNGGGAYTGIAPDASLIFLKAGNNITGNASTNAIVNAMDAAVNVYGAKIISLSYGCWDSYHDGSSILNQKVDWCYAQGTAVFLAAGNDAGSGRHYSGNVTALDSTGFIKINVTDAPLNTVLLVLNLVYYDGLNINNDLSLKYYNSSYEEITDISYFMPTESLRGTESRINYISSYLPEGNSVFYIRVINKSSSSQDFHIYENYNSSSVRFENPDPNYTITQPANSDYGFCVASYSNRDTWVAYDGSVHSFGQINDVVCSFSGRGPRIDGYAKPDITAPGSSVIASRDRDINISLNNYRISNDGLSEVSDYYIAEGTSFSAPIAAGAAALLWEKFPDASVEDIYNALKRNALVDSYTGVIPNNIYGAGKLDVDKALKDPVLNSVHSTLSLNEKVFLEGAYENGTMRLTLKNSGFIPLEQPYNISPWMYAGSESVTTIPDSIVDWVLLELRSSTSSASVVAKRAAFLKYDGNVVDLDGKSPVQFPELIPGSYYSIVYHRNHLGVMSALPVQFINDVTTYDFTESLNSAYGTEPMKLMPDKKYCLYSGDGNCTGNINVSDRNVVWRTQNGTLGYLGGDYNLSGSVSIGDANLYWSKNNGRISQIPY